LSPEAGDESEGNASEMKKHKGVQLAAAGVAVASAALTVIGAPAANAAPQPGRGGGVSAKTDPAVVLVGTNITATIQVAQPRVSQAAVQDLTRIAVTEAASGQIGTDSTSITTEVLRLIEKNPDRYLSPGPVDRFTSKLSSYGTGFIVTPDGYVVTAAHVTSPDPIEVRAEFSRFGLQQEARKAASSYRGLFAQLTGDQVKAFTNTILGWQARHMSLTHQNITRFAQLGVAVVGFDKVGKGVPVTLIGQGAAYPGRDVAIVKLGGNTATYPTVPVGTDADIHQGDDIYVDGYPAASTFFAATSADSQLQPTTTSGQVTAIKTTDQGTAIVQSQAPITPGNSGGPALNADGEVVALVSAAAVDTNSGTQAQGQNFFIAASVIQSMLNEHNIKPATSLTSQRYNAAVDDFDRQHYKAALKGFQQAQNLYPGHPYAGHFISESQAAISAGKDRTPSPFPMTYVILGGAAALLLLAGAASVLIVHRRRARRATRSPMSTEPALNTNMPHWLPTLPHTQPQLVAATAMPQDTQQAFAAPPPPHPEPWQPPAASGAPQTH
jgi:S1-C subfamily serine protease